MNTARETRNETTQDAREHRQIRRPRLDAWEGSNSYRVIVDLPGVDSDNLAVQVERDLLTVRGEHRRNDGEEALTVEYKRTLRLPEQCDPEQIEARLIDGVLTLDLAKRSDARVREIPITSS